MNIYSLSDVTSLPPQMHLSTFPEAQDPLHNCNLCSSSGEAIYPELPGLNLYLGHQMAGMANDDLGENVGRLSQCEVKKVGSAKIPETSPDGNSLPLLQELGLAAPKTSEERDQAENPVPDSTRRGRRPRGSPQNSSQECSLCCKIFSSASSLSKHYLTHSQERKHGCKICNKAFKRQDHLTGHMLTHQKNKPFVCTQLGCKKSYCDYRSLRRHYEVQHNMCPLKEGFSDEGTHCTSPQPSQDPPHQARALEKPASQTKSPNSVLPNRDLLRRLVSRIVTQKLPPSLIVSSGQYDGGMKDPIQSCLLTSPQGSRLPENSNSQLEGMGADTVKEYHTSVATSSVFTLINSANLPTIAPVRAIREPSALNMRDDSFPSEPQLLQHSAGLDCWPNTQLPCFQVFRGPAMTAGSQLQSQNFPWIRNMPAFCNNKESSTCTAPEIAIPCTSVPEGRLPAFDTFAQTFSSNPCIPTTSMSLEDVKLSTGEETLRPRVKSEAFPWQHLGEQSHPHFQNPSHPQGDPGPLFRQLFLKCQEPPLSQEQMQVQQRLLHMITTSQHILSHTQVATQSQLSMSEAKYAVPKPPPNVLQLPEVIQPLPRRSCFQGSPGQVKTLTAVWKETASSVKPEQAGIQQVATSSDSVKNLAGCGMNSSASAASGPVAFPDSYSELEDMFSIDGILPSTNMGEDSPGRQPCSQSGQLESSIATSCPNEKTQEMGSKLYPSGSRPRRITGSRKEKLKFNLCHTASPSQVAMASFSNSMTSNGRNEMKPKLTVFNKIQGGQIYSLPNSVAEETFLEGCKANGGTADWDQCQASSYMCQNCKQLFYTEKGLKSHMCFHSQPWHSPSEVLDLQMNREVCSTDVFTTQRTRPKLPESGLTFPGSMKPTEDGPMAPLVMPVSVPVTPSDRDVENKEADSEQLDKSSKEGRNKRRKKRPRPKALYIPPPAPPLDGLLPVAGGFFQSQLRSPSLFLADHVLGSLIRCPPYTPPPMLSPIREGSGLYFNTICPPSVKAGPGRFYTHLLGRSDGTSGSSIVKDNTIFSVEPHINIGSRFQAEIPQLQDRSLVQSDKHPASMVWKPWGNVETSQDTQDRVSQLLNLACSSVMPGGGTNIELALHCLHATQGHIVDALEMLLVSGPRKPPSHPLAHYHYSGTDNWTASEKRLFKKGFCAHRKDFHFIQNMIQTKNVSQCVEYYYTWKKIIKFDQSRSQAADKKVKVEQSEADEWGDKTMHSIEDNHNHIQQKGQDGKVLKSPPKLERRNPSAAQTKACHKPGSIAPPEGFACIECGRVFEKIKSRNAHMKRHRQQDKATRPPKKWSKKYLKVQVKEEVKEEASPLNLWTTPCELPGWQSC